MSRRSKENTESGYVVGIPEGIAEAVGRGEPISADHLKQLALEIVAQLKPQAKPARKLASLYREFLPALVRDLATDGDVEIPWRKRLLPHLGHETSETLTRARIEAVLEATCKSPRTWNKTRRAGLVLVEAARDEGEWPKDTKNPFTAVKPKSPRKRKVKLLTSEQLLALFEHARPHRRALFASAFYMGPRKMELGGMKVEDLNLPKRLFSVLRSGTRDVTKNGEQRESLPVNDELVPYLEAHLAGHTSEWLFPASTGKQMHRGVGLEKELRRTLARAGIVSGYMHKCRKCRHAEEHKDPEPRKCPEGCMKLWPSAIPVAMRFHDLRHHAASYLKEAGCDNLVRKILLGHTVGDITDGTYTHLTEGFMRSNINKLRLQPPSPDPKSPAEGRRSDVEGIGVRDEGFEPTAFGSGGPRSASRRPAAVGPSPFPVKGYRTPGEVAQVLGVCRATVYRLIEDGPLVASRVGAQLRIHSDDLEAYLASTRKSATP